MRGKLARDLTDTSEGCYHHERWSLHHHSPVQKVKMGGCSAKVAPTTSLSSSANKKTLNGELPAHWSTVAAKEYQSNGFCAVKLSKDDNVWQQLERFLEVDDAQNLGRGRDTQQKAQQKYDRLRLAAAWRVQNPALWSRYVAGKAKIRRDVHGLQKLGKGLPKRGGPGLPLRLHDRAKATVEAALPGEKLDDEVKGWTALTSRTRTP